ELLAGASARRRHQVRPQSADGAHRSALRALRRAPGAPVRRRAEADRAALLHERPGAEFPPGLTSSGDDAQLSALARRRVADHAELGLEPLELLLLGLALGLDVTLLALGLFLGLLAQVRDGDAMAEDFVAAQPQLGFGPFGQAVANLSQFRDQLVEGHMVRNIDEILDAPLHW